MYLTHISITLLTFQKNNPPIRKPVLLLLLLLYLYFINFCHALVFSISSISPLISQSVLLVLMQRLVKRVLVKISSSSRFVRTRAWRR